MLDTHNRGRQGAVSNFSLVDSECKPNGSPRMRDLRGGLSGCLLSIVNDRAVQFG